MRLYNILLAICNRFLKRYKYGVPAHGSHTFDLTIQHIYLVYGGITAETKVIAFCFTGNNQSIPFAKHDITTASSVVISGNGSHITITNNSAYAINYYVLDLMW